MSQTEHERTFTQEHAAQMYDMLRTLEHGLQRTNAIRARQVTALLDRIDAYTPPAAAAPASQPAQGRFKVGSVWTDDNDTKQWIYFEHPDGEYTEHEAAQAAAALNASAPDSTEAGG